jgi:hypothetical protein
LQGAALVAEAGQAVGTRSTQGGITDARGQPGYETIPERGIQIDSAGAGQLPGVTEDLSIYREIPPQESKTIRDSPAHKV